MYPQRQIYTQRARKKKSWPDLPHLVHFAFPVHCQVDRVSRSLPGQIEETADAAELDYRKMSKLSIGCIENGSAVSDLPPGDLKKKELG